MKDKKFWKRGAVEAVSFLVLFPVLVLVFMFLLYIMQLTITTQSLSFAAYYATRAAVVSETEEDAYNNANIVANKCLPTGYMRIKNATWSYTTEDGDPDVWVKGKVIRGTITVDADLRMVFFGAGERKMTASAVCMVERPAT